MMEALWQVTNEGRGGSHNRGGLPLRPLVAMLQPQNHSYREALESVQPHENRDGGSDNVKAQRGASASQGNWHGLGRAPLTAGRFTAQWKGGSGRPVVSLAEGGVHSTLLDVKAQLGVLQDIVDYLIWSDEEKRDTDMGLEISGLGIGLGLEINRVLDGQLKRDQMGLGLDVAGPNMAVDVENLSSLRGPSRATTAECVGCSFGPQPVRQNGRKERLGTQRDTRRWPRG